MPAVSQNDSQKLLLPWPADLKQVATAANTRGSPLVLMVSLPGCPWCELLRRNYLGPMQSEGLAVYEFMVNERSRMLQDFKSQRITPSDLSTALKITTTPTLLFFDAQGIEIAPRVEGVASTEFVGTILDERLVTARQQLKSAK